MGVSFAKWLERGRDSLGNREKGRGPRANLPSSPSFRLGNRGGGGKAPAAVNPAGLSSGDGRGGGEKKEGGERI